MGHGREDRVGFLDESFLTCKKATAERTANSNNINRTGLNRSAAAAQSPRARARRKRSCATIATRTNHPASAPCVEASSSLLLTTTPTQTSRHIQARMQDITQSLSCAPDSSHGQQRRAAHGPHSRAREGRQEHEFLDGCDTRGATGLECTMRGVSVGGVCGAPAELRRAAQLLPGPGSPTGPASVWYTARRLPPPPLAAKVLCPLCH